MDIDIARVLVAFAVLLVSLTFHEAAHAWSADRLGDPTARQLGRVSLNPVVHIDPIGTILFPLIAMVTNFPIIGWAKPVPVNTHNLGGHWKQKFMAIAAAGRASNVVLAVICALGVRLMGFETEAGGVGGTLFRFLILMVIINVLLAVFNMLPVPPLDGGNVLAGLLRGRAYEIFDGLRPYGIIILYAILLTGVFDRVVLPIQDAAVRWLL